MNQPPENESIQRPISDVPQNRSLAEIGQTDAILRAEYMLDTALQNMRPPPATQSIGFLMQRLEILHKREQERQLQLDDAVQAEGYRTCLCRALFLKTLRAIER